MILIGSFISRHATLCIMDVDETFRLVCNVHTYNLLPSVEQETYHNPLELCLPHWNGIQMNDIVYEHLFFFFQSIYTFKVFIYPYPI